MSTNEIAAAVWSLTERMQHTDIPDDEYRDLASRVEQLAQEALAQEATAQDRTLRARVALCNAVRKRADTATTVQASDHAYAQLDSMLAALRTERHLIVWVSSAEQYIALC